MTYLSVRRGTRSVLAFEPMSSRQGAWTGACSGQGSALTCELPSTPWGSADKGSDWAPAKPARSWSPRPTCGPRSW